MELKGSKTEKNLGDAFAGEAQAFNTYKYFADEARNKGLSLIADIFMEIAQNEGEHARRQFEFLGRIRDTGSNLEVVAGREEYEHTVMYPEFAQTAREEGFQAIADYFDRLSKIEGKHEEICLALLKNFKRTILPEEKTVSHSAITMAELMLPHQANPSGYVHGGEIMKLMDNAAGVVALRHTRMNVVTARVEDINFINPVKVGDLVLVHAFLSFVGHSSMEVRVKVETEDPTSGRRQQALTAYFIYVALDKMGKPARVPALIITTEEGEILFEEGRKRYETRKKQMI